jgi:uncharacterized protein (TIGR04222 family)
MVGVAADTWGISGTNFLLIYLGLAAVTAIAIAVRRRALLGSPFGGRDTSLLDYQLALLNGGPELAVMVAVARLRGAHVLAPGPEAKTLRIHSRPKRELDPLEREVFMQVSNNPDLTTRDIRVEVATGPTVAELEQVMRADGLLVDRKTARQLWLLCLWPLPLLALGIVRLIDGAHNHKPIGYLTVLVIAMAAAMVWLAFTRPRATAKGMAALESAQRQRANWRRAPRDIAPGLAVALFGGAALWAVDPSFAAACSIPREMVGTGWINHGSGFFGGASCSGGGGCGGGSSCGGGGGGGCGG